MATAAESSTAVSIARPRSAQIARGGHLKNRVFFADEATALAASYRPCGAWMRVDLKPYEGAWTAPTTLGSAVEQLKKVRCTSVGTTIQPPIEKLFVDDDPPRPRPEIWLPPGRIVKSRFVRIWPVAWLSNEAVALSMWRAYHAVHKKTGLWPLVAIGRYDEPDSPWAEGVLWPHVMSKPDDHTAEQAMRQLWGAGPQDECWADRDKADGSDQESGGYREPGRREFPGIVARPALQRDPDEVAYRVAKELAEQPLDPVRRVLARHHYQDSPLARLALVAGDRGSDALAACGWMGAANHTNDTGLLAAILRDWEDRLGVRVVGAGWDTLHLSVAAPPQTFDEAIAITAEHYAFSHDIEEPFAAYAESLIGEHRWDFWWD